MSSLACRHIGRFAVIMGGGPSLQRDLARVGAGGIRIAVNHYASLWGIASNYTVFNDRHTLDLIKPTSSALVCRWADLADHRQYWPAKILSARLAVWLARTMGCAPIVLCGMDCTGMHGNERVDARWYLDRWMFECPDDLMVASGPMQQLYPRAPDVVTPAPLVTVEVTPGPSVPFDNMRSSSVRGGTYDLGAMGLAGARTEKLLQNPRVRAVTQQ